MTREPEVLLITPRFRVVRRLEPARDGSPHPRYTVEHPGAVTIVPMVDADHVCLIRNYRVSVGQTLLELPAGTLEQGEDPLATAHRELAEETGYRAGTIERLCEFYMSPGILNERMHLFLATELSAGPAKLEIGEEIETEVVPWNEAVQWATDGMIRDAKTLVGLFYVDRLRGRDGTT